MLHVNTFPQVVQFSIVTVEEDSFLHFKSTSVQASVAWLNGIDREPLGSLKSVIPAKGGRVKLSFRKLVAIVTHKLLCTHRALMIIER